MPTQNRIDGDLIVSGAVVASTLEGSLARGFIGRTDDSIEIPFHDLRVWDAYATLLPGTSATDDLGLATGTFGTSAPYVTTGDVKTTSGTRYARILWPVPSNYVVQDTILVGFEAGMQTTVADGSCTLDLQAYKIAADGTVSGADRVLTAAQSINTIGPTNKTFELSLSDGLVEPGDLLDMRIAITWVDAATATAVIAKITRIYPSVASRG